MNGATMMAESQAQPTEVQPEAEPQHPTYENEEQLEAALRNGELDVSNVSLDDLEGYIKKPEEEPTAEPSEQDKQPAEEPPQEPTVEPDVSRETPDIAKFKTFGELMKFASEELGESIPDARSLVIAAKNKKQHLGKLQSAVERWREDATKHKTTSDSLKAQLAALKKQLEQKPQQQQPAPQPQPQQKQEEPPEPEIPMPDDLADQKEWNEYYSKVNERNLRVARKEQQKEIEALKEQVANSTKTWQEQLESEKKRLKAENDERLRREAAQRQVDSTVNAAEDFVSRHKEFDFGDQASVRAKNEEWGRFVQTCNYLSEQTPGWQGKNLAAEYANGDPLAVKLIEERGVVPPAGAKQFSLLIEMDKIAQAHNLYKNRSYDSAGNEIPGSGKPDFDAAYTLLKQRSGALVDEINEAAARGANQALDAVQARQASPVNEQLSAQEAQGREENKAFGQQQALERLTQLQSKMSSMGPEQAQKAMLEIERLASEAGLELQTPAKE